MNLWRQRVGSVSRRGLGAGVVTGLTALVVSVGAFILPVTTDPAWLSADARYWIGYAPQFALVAGLLVGTLVWGRLASPAGTPRRGALVGAAIAVGTLLVVPILAGLYVAAFPVVLGVFSGAEWGTVARVVPGYLRASLGVTRTVALGWSPLVAVVLVPLGALGGWASQRLGRPGR
jgi:MFS family permease